ncbi:hypothetical protein FGA82_28040 [Pseudomonas fluorescens]|nr:hypothetical protein [Pseudomonas fluorescens]TMU70479.1 hypothetical protein FGA82_28040 [Pseudomonas fluorescens]
MTIPVASNLPLLVGQTTAATIGNPGNAGVNPQIALTTATGAAVTPLWDTTGNSGKGTITLPVTAADGTTVLGSMSMKVKVGGIRAVLVSGNGNVALQSTHTESGGTDLYGAVAQSPSAAGSLGLGSIAAAWNEALGAYSANVLLAQLNTASGRTATYTHDNQQLAFGFGNSAEYYAGTYGLGVAQGDNITVNFTNPVTNTTTWKTSLKATITYL